MAVTKIKKETKESQEQAAFWRALSDLEQREERARSIGAQAVQCAVRLRDQASVLLHALRDVQGAKSLPRAKSIARAALKKAEQLEKTNNEEEL